MRPGRVCGGCGGGGGSDNVLIMKLPPLLIKSYPSVRGSHCGHSCRNLWQGSLTVGGHHGNHGHGHLALCTPLHGARLTLSWKAVMSHSSTSRLEPRFSAAMNCSRFSCFMPGVLKISRSLCHDCLS